MAIPVTYAFYLENDQTLRSHFTRRISICAINNAVLPSIQIKGLLWKRYFLLKLLDAVRLYGDTYFLEFHIANNNIAWTL